MRNGTTPTVRDVATGGIRLSTWSTSPHNSVKSLTDHLSKLVLPKEGEQYVIDAFSSPPARRVGRHRVRNLIFDVPLPQFGVTVQAESATGEYAFLLERSRDTSILMILDQPTTVFFDITNKAGVRTPTPYTADYLIVYRDRVLVYEVVLQKELDELVSTRKDDWTVSSDGRAHYVPAEHYFGRLGISHVVHVGETISGVHAENLRTLQAVRRFPDTDQLAAERAKVLRLFDSNNAQIMSEALRQLGLSSYTPILQLVDSGTLHVDIKNCVLADPRGVWVCSDPDLPRHLTSGRARLLDALGVDQSVDAIDACPPQYEAEFLIRLACCNLLATSDPPARCPRTIRNYLLRLKRANGDVRVLIPRWHLSGNKTLRKPDAHYQILSAEIRKARSDPNGSSPATAFLAYQVTLREMLGEGERPFSQTTFYKQYSVLAGASDDARRRGGRRMGNAEAPWLDPLLRTLLPTRPFEVAHIDHWEVDIVAVLPVGTDKVVTARPWLTAMVDSFSGEVLAMWLTFRAPSRTSCAMVLRDCVRRHNKLPEIVIVDGGPEFDSVHFASTLAALGVTRVNRSPEDPRFGKEAERLFGAYKERFARGKPGFTEGIKAARKVSGKLSADRRAELTIGDLLSSLETFTFTSYNGSSPPGQLMARGAIRAQSLSAFPFSGVSTSWDTRFLILTAVEAPQSSYQLGPPRGVRVLNRWYSCPALAAYRGPKGHVYVRIDPFDDSVIYVCLKSLWYVCFTSDASRSLHGSELTAFERTSLRHQMRGLLKDVMNAAARDAYELQHCVPKPTGPASPEPSTTIMETAEASFLAPDVAMIDDDISEIPLDGDQR